MEQIRNYREYVESDPVRVCQAGVELGLERELSWSAGAFYLCISGGIIRGGLREMADRLAA